jgi:hypothetical protein
MKPTMTKAALDLWLADLEARLDAIPNTPPPGTSYEEWMAILKVLVAIDREFEQLVKEAVRAQKKALRDAKKAIAAAVAQGARWQDAAMHSPEELGCSVKEWQRWVKMYEDAEKEAALKASTEAAKAKFTQQAEDAHGDEP